MECIFTILKGPWDISELVENEIHKKKKRKTNVHKKKFRVDH